VPEASEPLSAIEPDLAQPEGEGAPGDPEGTVVVQDLGATNGMPDGEPTVEPRKAEREPAGTRGQVR